MNSTPQLEGIDLKRLRPKESDADRVLWHRIGRQVKWIGELHRWRW